MKRSVVHGLFAGVTLALLSMLIWQWKQYSTRAYIHEAVAAVPTQFEPEDLEAANELKHPEVKLATASALALDGQFDAAESMFNSVIKEQLVSSLGNAAQYNLANTYLRQAGRDDIAGNRKRPLLELAKQHYRNVLREEPQNWNARYNLEQALRLAPELPDDDNDMDKDPVKSVDVVVPGFKVRDLP